MGRPTEVLGFQYTTTNDNGKPKVTIEVGEDRIKASAKET